MAKRIKSDDVGESVSAYAKRAFSPKERPEFEAMLLELVRNNALPLELLDRIPAPPEEVGKTRFDQVYDAAMSLVFPGYERETLQKLLGPDFSEDVKIWRAMFPPKFGLSHVLLRANSFQHAFALGCDYACRMSLRVHRRVPTDLTLRICFVSERAVRRILQIRWFNKVNRRNKLKLVGRTFSPKEVTGARLVAIGRPDRPGYSIFRYAEARDLRKILSERDEMRLSSVESEVFRRP